MFNIDNIVTNIILFMSNKMSTPTQINDLYWLTWFITLLLYKSQMFNSRSFRNVNYLFLSCTLQKMPLIIILFGYNLCKLFLKLWWQFFIKFLFSQPDYVYMAWACFFKIAILSCYLINSQISMAFCV